MQRQKKLTKRERKALAPTPRRSTEHAHQHIHCIACGRHIDPPEFTVPPVTATYITCDHGTQFPSCVSCSVQSEMLVQAHDRTNTPVKAARAWH